MKATSVFVIRVSRAYLSLLRKEWPANIGENGDEILIAKQLIKDREADELDIKVLRTY